MLPARLQCVAVSVLLHAALFGLAAGKSPTLPRLSVRRAALETAVSIEDGDELLGRPAHRAPPSEPPAPAVAAADAEAVARPRERRPPSPRFADRPPVSSRERVPTPASLAEPVPTPPAQSTRADIGPLPVVAPSPSPKDSGAESSASSGSDAAGSVAALSDVAGGVGSTRGAVRASNGMGRGVPSSTAEADGRARQLASYLAHVRARVDRHREYPYLARRANLEGTIRLRISIAASGQLLAVTPTAGASLEPLVDAALRSVSSSAPFPPLPTALGSRVTLDLPVDFRLDSL